MDWMTVATIAGTVLAALGGVVAIVRSFTKAQQQSESTSKEMTLHAETTTQALKRHTEATAKSLSDLREEIVPALKATQAASESTLRLSQEALRQAQAGLHAIDEERERRESLALAVARLDERTSPLRRTGKWQQPLEDQTK